MDSVDKVRAFYIITTFTVGPSLLFLFFTYKLGLTATVNQRVPVLTQPFH